MNKKLINHIAFDCYSTSHNDFDVVKFGMMNKTLINHIAFDCYSTSHNDFDVVKFAELILKEAMDIVRDEVSFHSDWACADNAITKVKEHFGVKV